LAYMYVLFKHIIQAYNSLYTCRPISAIEVRVLIAFVAIVDKTVVILCLQVIQDTEKHFPTNSKLLIYPTISVLTSCNPSQMTG